MLRTFAFCTGLAVAALCAAPAAAVVINFDTTPSGGTIADGTLIGGQYASLGVTFAAIDAGSNFLPVATSYAAGPAGPLYSGNYLGNSSNGAPGNPRYDIVRISFSAPASGISLSLNNFSLVGTTTFNAYNASGTLLQTFTTNAGNGWDTRSLLVGGVSRLDLLNNSFNGSELFFGIDQLNFTLQAAAVPEPATWAMMIGGMGLTGAALRRTRRHRATATAAA